MNASTGRVPCHGSETQLPLQGRPATILAIDIYVPDRSLAMLRFSMP